MPGTQEFANTLKSPRTACGTGTFYDKRTAPFKGEYPPVTKT